MNKRSGKHICTYCLKETREITDDHIFPRAWYPETTPSSIEKWVTPACRGCNNHYSAIEQKLMVRMGLCLNPESPNSMGIPQRALSAINPKLAKDERDRRARLSLRKRILKDMFQTNNPNLQGLLPNFGPQGGVDYSGSYTAIMIPANMLEELARKFIRGLLFKLENGFLIRSDDQIDIYHANDNRVPDVISIIERLGHTEYRGPGVTIQRAVGDLETIGAILRIVIWSRWTIYAVFQSAVGKP